MIRRFETIGATHVGKKHGGNQDRIVIRTFEQAVCAEADVRVALECAASAKVRNLILFHSSRRYEEKMLTTGIQSLLEETGLQCPVILLRGSFNLPTD